MKVRLLAVHPRNTIRVVRWRRLERLSWVKYQRRRLKRNPYLRIKIR